MKLKRTLSLLLSLAMVLGMLSGCGGETAEKEPIEQQRVSENTIVLDDELQRASNAGLLPEEWLSCMDEPVTIAEFNGLLTKIVEMQDPALVSEWESVAAQALQT